MMNVVGAGVLNNDKKNNKRFISAMCRFVEGYLIRSECFAVNFDIT